MNCFRRKLLHRYTAILALALGSAWMTPFASGQQANSAKENDEKAQQLPRDKRYTFDDLLNKNPDAVADAKKIFALSSDPKIKQRTASILLSIGVKDPIYFDYLLASAKAALKDDTPWSTVYYDNGEINKNAINPAFLDWCKKHHADPSAAHMAQYYEIPVPWYYLAAAGDRRAYDLLVQGLHSHNLMIAAWASWGLAKLQEPKAIDELIGAGHRLPGEARAAIGEALLQFQDPRAQAAADELVADKKHLEIARRDAQSKRLKALFPY